MKQDRLKYGFLGFILGLLVYWVGQGQKVAKNGSSESDTVHIVDTIYTTKVNPDKLVRAFASIESSNNTNARNKSSGASGIIQIMPIMVKEANRLVGYEKYTLQDRFSKEKSFEIFHLIMKHKNPEYDIAKACFIWNPNGKTDYTKRVEEVYNELIK